MKLQMDNMYNKIFLSENTYLIECTTKDNINEHEQHT